MRNALTNRITRSRPRGWIAPLIVVALGVALSASAALGRVEPVSTQQSAAAMSQDTVAIVTGGGTVTVPEGTMNFVASFGLNARRPDGFTGGVASGRVNYDEHGNVSTRRVNAPVMFMEAAMSAQQTPNGTGGNAAVSADCTPPAECPSGYQSVIVYVEDNSDSGAQSDRFKIYFCTVPPFTPPSNFTGGSLAGSGCVGPEGDLLRTGNIQVRQTITGSSATVPTAARAPLRLP